MIESVFWIFLLIAIYTYIVYPLIIMILSLFINKKVTKGDIEPFVSIIITAYNEEKHIRKKIENTLSLDYPEDKLEIIVASDGSTDKTDEIVKDYHNLGVQLIHVEGRVGKTELQNRTVNIAKGEIIIFSDAASMYEKDAIRKIIRNFADPEVGGVSGKCQYVDPDDTAPTPIPTKIYWWYEDLIRKCQSRIGYITGASGLIYAVRKEYYVPLPPDIISDMIEPIMIVKQKKRFIYEPEAIAYEETTSEFRQEFRMRVRVILRGMVGMIFVYRFLNPAKYSWLSFQLFSHKVLRWFIPFYLIGLFVTNLFLISTPVYLFTFLIQSLFYAMAIIPIFLGLRNNKAFILNMSLYICVLSGASLIAFIKVLAGDRITTWETER